MWPESAEKPKKLKTGLTTGACATACSVAAAHFLMADKKIERVSIRLPKGQQVEMDIVSLKKNKQQVLASTIKDAGDDPDVTHGAEIAVMLEQAASGIHFKAGRGVGTVTREGLLLDVGEPAINPVPRQMITEHLQDISTQYDYEGGFSVTVSIPEGEALALKTMNPKLGILGGLSVLGTTGIVRPFSCAAYIASIHQGVDVARANGITHIAATTGNASETYVKETYGFTDMALIEMGDFAGALLKHLRHHPVEKLTLCGGFGKISKLAAGHRDLHSKVSSIDFDFLASTALSSGGSDTLLANIKSSNTSQQALKMCLEDNIPLGDAICLKAKAVIESIVKQPIEVLVLAINRQGDCVGSSA